LGDSVADERLLLLGIESGVDVPNEDALIALMKPLKE
jgi:hypothetical protein